MTISGPGWPPDPVKGVASVRISLPIPSPALMGRSLFLSYVVLRSMGL